MKTINQSRRQLLNTFAAATAAGSSLITAPAIAQAKPAVDATTSSRWTSRKVLSISAVTVMSDDAFVVADWRGNQLHSVKLPEMKVAKDASFNILDLSDRLAKAFETDSSQLRVTAAAFHSKSQTAVLAVAVGKQVNAPVAVVLVSHAGEISMLDIDSSIVASMPLASQTADSALWGKDSARTLTVTDMKQFGNELIVTGLTNVTFSSTIRRIAYPFKSQGSGVTSTVDMYHAVHNQIETRAPVRAFNLIEVDGKPTMLAAYTCTPLVTVPLEALKDGAHVRGKTIAELGFGNTPLDVLPITINYQGKKSEWVLIANAAKSADLLSLPDIVAAAKGDGLSKPVKAPFEQHAGVKSIPVPITNVQRLLDQSPQFLLALRRNPQSAQLQLTSYRKGAFFRLSDFVNEYDFASYNYPAADEFQQNYIRPFHKMMKTDEGHSALVK
jgi:hypothetical protein